MNKNIVSTCAILAATAAFCPFVLSAMPTRAELKEAQPIVSELMAADVAALKAGKTDAKAVAEKALGYVDEASTDAAKYLLLQGAFYNYTNAKDYDKAADTVDKLRETIPDMEPKALSAMIAKALRKGRAAGRLSELQEKLNREVYYARMLKDVEGELKVKPHNQKLLRQAAEYAALMGNWKSALPRFAELGGKEAAVVAFEEGNPSKLTAADVAEFWWSYPVLGGEAEDQVQLKAHAAKFYRDALADETLKGLKRTIAEKRVAEVEATGRRSTLESPIKSEKQNQSSRATNMSLGKNEHLEMLDIKPGSFVMGLNGVEDPHDVNFEHKVKLTYRFQISRTPITVGQWEEATGAPFDYKLPENKALGPKAMVLVGYPSAEKFCEKLTKKLARNLPKGYKFRLPTQAEWEYVFTEGGESTDAFYLFSSDATVDNFKDSDYGCSSEEVYALLEKKGFPSERVFEAAVNRKVWGLQNSFKERGGIPRDIMTLSVERKPNAFGACDFPVFNRTEMLLDSSPVMATVADRSTVALYAKEETNPLHGYKKKPGDGPTARAFICRSHRLQRFFLYDIGVRIHAFRVVLGPELKPIYYSKPSK